jgi:drug/metabolite transporter (DMT)-like permease
MLVFVSLVIALAWILMNKKLMEKHGPLGVTTCTVLAGTLMLAVWIVPPSLLGWTSAAPLAHISMKAWAALVVSGIFCTASTTLFWNWGIHHVPASRAGIFLNLEPAIGSVLGVTLLGESMGAVAWIGGGLILASAVFMTLREHGTEPEVILE